MWKSRRKRNIEGKGKEQEKERVKRKWEWKEIINGCPRNSGSKLWKCVFPAAWPLRKTTTPHFEPQHFPKAYFTQTWTPITTIFPLRFYCCCLLLVLKGQYCELCTGRAQRSAQLFRLYRQGQKYIRAVSSVWQQCCGSQTGTDCYPSFAFKGTVIFMLESSETVWEAIIPSSEVGNLMTFCPSSSLFITLSFISLSPQLLSLHPGLLLHTLRGQTEELQLWHCSLCVIL